MSARTKTSRRKKTKPATFDVVRRILLALPGVEEGTSYGTPAFRVSGKMLARFHRDGESLVVPMEFAAREVLMGANLETFFISPITTAVIR